MDLFKWNWWVEGGGGFGLMSNLISQLGNGGSDIGVRMVYNGVTSGGSFKGTWASGSTYVNRDLVRYPNATSQLIWRANQSTSAGQSPDTHPSKWDLEVGLEMVQNIGSGKYTRYLLGIRNDDMIRTNGIERGTYTTSAFIRRQSNYVGGGYASLTIGTSSTSMVLGSSHPSAKSLTTSTGLSISNSTSLGSSSSSFAIPTTHPTMLNITLPSGLGLVAGDYITMYGDANNFFVLVIARYNNSTGATYGGSTVHVGSGTFSNWTVKREKLIYGFRTSDSVNKNFYALVQSYDSGTGVLNFNTINNTGTGTHSDWTIQHAKQPVTPSTTDGVSIQNANNAFGTFGVWVVGSFHGDRLQLRGSRDNRGTGILCVYTGGPDIANPPANVTVDTYNVASLTSQSTNAFTGLTKGTHSFICFSIVSPTVASTNTRVWLSADSDGPEYSFNEQYEYDVFTPDITAGPTGAESFGGIAWKFRDTNAADTSEWMPEHSNVQTCMGRTGRIFDIDGVTLSNSDEDGAYMLKFKPFTAASLTQTLNVVHPQAVGNMASLSIIHSFDRNGLYYKLINTWLQAGLIETGYNNMVFLGEAWFNKIIGQNAVTMARPADNTSVNMASDFKDQASYLFYSTGADPLDKFVIGQFWPNASRDWRIGGTSLGTPFVQDFLSTGGAKFYPFVFQNYSFAINDEITVEGRLYGGNKGNLILT